MIYLHPQMEPRLDIHGIHANDRTFISYGLDPAANDAVSAQPRIYDAVWIGRVHRQKGIDDLLATLKFLALRMEHFRAVFIGNVREKLLPEVRALGLEKNVEFSGFVARTPVVAYEIPNYRPLFGDLVRYAPPFDLSAFRAAAEKEILKMRAGENYLDSADLEKFKRENSWETARKNFLGALEKMRPINDARK
jgi:hypothetical protein